MPRNTEMFSAHRAVNILAVMALALFGFAGRAHTQEAPARDRIYVVTHVDVTPDHAAEGSKALQQYVGASRKEKGAVRVEATVQISRTNHFTVVEVWQNKQAYDAHESSGTTKKFRELVQPWLGSPFDERLHQIIE